MCENNKNYRREREKERDRQPANEQSEYRNGEHIHERVEESDSTKNPPKER